MIAAVIGKNFGDEGKGLAVDDFCGRVPCCLVVKHNGGAQAGHTVCFGGRRFVFHQLSSGSFRGADTYWASTFYPDLYKLRSEIREFTEAAGESKAGIFASKDTAVTIIDDVILNMALETSRGEARHGSCGMGINEADLRTKAGFGITFGDLRSMNAESLAARLQEIRRDYVIPRFLREIPTLSPSYAGTLESEEYEELLKNEAVLYNAAAEMTEALRFVEIVEDEAAFLKKRENIIFESGQGLLLDSENKEFAPHVTASRTGLHNVGILLKKAGLKLTEACYVSRTYVTRHGAGPLPCEATREELGVGSDLTNVENAWQGSIRYGKHESMERFLSSVSEDLNEYERLSGFRPEKVSLYLTHLNETNSRILMEDGEVRLKDFTENEKIHAVFNRIYCSFYEEKAAEIRELG